MSGIRWPLTQFRIANLVFYTNVLLCLSTAPAFSWRGVGSSRFRGVRLQYSFATLETRGGNSSRGASRNCFRDRYWGTTHRSAIGQFFLSLVTVHKSLREYSFLLFSKWRVNDQTSGFRLREMSGYQAPIGVCIAVLSLQFS